MKSGWLALLLVAKLAQAAEQDLPPPPLPETEAPAPSPAPPAAAEVHGDAAAPSSPAARPGSVWAVEDRDPSINPGDEVPYRGGPLPPHSHLVDARPAWALWTGTGLLAGGYSLALVLGFIDLFGGILVRSPNEGYVGWWLLPAVGPWVVTARPVALPRGFAITTGAIQDIGLGLLIYGLVPSIKKIHYDAIPIVRALHVPDDLELRVVPSSSPTFTGMTLMLSSARF